MRYLWFITLSMLVLLASWMSRQPVLLVAELLVIDLFITRRINWLFWIKPISFNIPVFIHILIWVFATTLIIRTLLADSYTVISTSMRPTLQRGDNVLISKLAFGPRFPITPINFPFAHHYIPFSRCRRSFVDGFTMPYLRGKGIRPVKRGDLLAYNFPEGDTALCGVETISYYELKRAKSIRNEKVNMEATHFRPVDRREVEINRCVGLPGDTIRILQGKVMVNDQPFHNPEKTSFDYLVEVENRQLPVKFLNQLGLQQAEITIHTGLGYSIPLLNSHIPAVRQRPEVIAISPNLTPTDQPDYNIFPHDPKYPWNRDAFGPIIVPAKGDSIKLTPEVLPVYGRIIQVYENNKLQTENGVVLINDEPAQYYRFKMNYYFLAGDNRHHSRDSRHWGFLPEDHIIGQPVMIWFSARRNPDGKTEFFPDRFFQIPK